MKSIRAFLTYSLVASIGLAIFIAIGMSYQRITHETEELYDAELAQISRVLEAVLTIEFEFTGVSLSETVNQDQKLILPPEIYSDEEYDSSGHKYEKKLAFQVWSRKGVPLLGSDAGNSVLSFSPDQGYSQELIGDQHWRTFMLYSDKLAVWIKVAQQVAIRDEVTHEIATLNASVMLLLLPITLILITLIVRKGLAPLNEINREIAQRDNSNLQPLSFSRIPQELTAVVESVNLLMRSLERALERQKRFTGNAAHELRTPLAAIKVHAQNLYPDNARQQKIQDSIVQGVDKLTHLFNQLITLSQTECSQSPGPRQPLQLKPFITELAAEMQTTLEKRQITLEMDLDDCSINANPDTLGILLRNLLDNAIKYTPEQGHIRILAQQQQGQTCLSLSDDGPGMTSEQRQQAFERFYRASSQDTFGCGIGLSIVKEICDQSGYSVQLSDSEIAASGLTVSVCGL